MPKVNIRQTAPDHFVSVKAEQEELKRTYSSSAMVARLCPYCSHMVEVLFCGTHGSSHIHCPKCGEGIFFPPVVFHLK